MNKLLLVIVSVTICASVNAQVTVKKDVMQYYSSLSAMPATLEEAYQKCICKTSGCSADSLVAPLLRNTKADQNAMQNLTPTQQQQMKQGEALGKQAQADHVQSMTDDQKLQYAQGNQQFNGGNPQAIAWAQKLKDDPAEKAKFQNMTPDQKMAYMQQNGVMNRTVTPGVMLSADSNKASDALNKQKLMFTAENSDSSQKFQQGLSDKTDMTKLNAAHADIDKQEQAELSKVPQVGEGSISLSSPAAKLIHNKFMKKHMELAQTQLLDMTKAYQDLYNYYMRVETDYANALKTVNYGYTGDATQDKNLNNLVQGQADILSKINGLANNVKSIYEFGAKWQAQSMQK